MDAPEVTATRQGGALIICIDRPQARNAVNLAVAQGISTALDELESDDELRVGIITGAGGTFCAGMDLKAFVRGELPIVEGRGFAGLVNGPPAKPLIAAVEGYALAGGFEIVLACDLVVAAKGASFGIPEVRRSLVAGGGGLLRLPQRIPYHQAMEFALLGNHFSAERACELGLVNRLVDDGDALTAALELAGQVAANGPLAVIASKRIIVESRDWSSSQAWDLQDAIADPVAHSSDAIEGATAFAEKREPVWRGR
ncbi:short chain enoyl-CoA hydratase [Jatrophihabitans sp. GAS493]|uniref:crotonase/enoyl-CoA hydratase family protein n=1 Tax=Jatrophihabitans sp. GAS493 TaxID=1907575 RepID=UPI000BB70E72|nr:crotonase/enoyl-CoA hydratase family protein [Jatrophihabitans sp. GAS493]SOD74637.1 short chain enoyl-CoA hydratase [Jatrophihabitans sp. GAS493]